MNRTLLLLLAAAGLVTSGCYTRLTDCATADHEHGPDEVEDEVEDDTTDDELGDDDDSTDAQVGDDDDATDDGLGDDDDATDPPEQPSCTYAGFPALLHQAILDDTNPAQPLFTYQARDSEYEPFDELRIASYQAEPYFGPSQPGSFSLAGSNYADCALCVLLITDCDEAYSCDRVFFADAGTVDVFSMGSAGTNFSATLTDVVFQEVEIDSDTYVSTPVPGGDTWCVDGFQIDLVTQGPY
ncbi:MAG: hypothetical protein KDA24_29690 [Deltaproteobacteria bacterium]|nr:hypothetical protein [Deltaproteobacteria bacterium]